MPKKRILKQEEINEIIRLYDSGELKNTRKIARQFKMDEKNLRKLLLENNIKLNPKEGNTTHGLTKLIYENRTILKPTVSEGKELAARCKTTNVIIKNISKISTNLIKHLKQLDKNFKIPNTYQQNKYEYEKKESWYSQFFDFIEIDPTPTKKCHYCNDWETTDITNKTGWLTHHIIKDHGISIDDHLMKYPEESVFHKTHIKKQEKKAEQNDYNSVKCEICGERFGCINHSHLFNKHNMTVEQYKLLYNTEICSEKNKEDSRKQMIELNTNILKPKYVSKGEIEISEMFKSHNIDVIESNRKLLGGKEVDLLIESHKIGIEFNGCKFHTEWYGDKTPQYHLDKTITLNKLGYSLIHIFEDEWELSKTLVLNKLKYVTGILEAEKIGARKCNIKSIDAKEKDSFLDSFHIQGKDKSAIRYGAYYDNILVGVMTFRKESGNKNVFILNRFATNYNYIISGLASKMLNKFISEYNPSSIISFADRRWTLNSDNNMYTKLGFKLVKTLRPNYAYFNSKYHRTKRFHKFNFRKHLLLKRYPDQVTSDMTETEMIKKLGFDRIWDCGLFKYELNL